MDRDINLVVQAYIECMLWADCPEELVGQVHEASPELKAQAREDVADFLDLIEWKKLDTMGWSDIQLGHDFWLTRQHHGAGFWDRGLPAGEALTNAAQTYGEKYLYVGDDGLFYCD